MTRMKLKGLRAGRAAAVALCLALCAAAAVAPSHAAAAASGVFDNGVSWALDSGGTLTISGSGPIPFMGMAAMNQPPSWRDARRLVIENGVTDIGYMAFLSLEKLEEVSLPDSLRSIGYGAFWHCTGLTRFRIPAGLQTVDDAFSYCTSLEAFEVSPGNGIFRAVDGVLFSRDTLEVYPEGRKASSYTIPQGVTEIAEGAFRTLCLEEIILPDSLTTIRRWAFASCEALRHVALGSAVAEIGDGAFLRCPAVERFTVAADNAHFIAPDGVLFTRDGAELLFYPLGRTAADYAVPWGTISIADTAFSGCSTLTRVTIPEGVTSIGASAFSNCTSLEDVTIPASVTEFGGDAFHNTPWLAKQGDLVVVNDVVLYYQGDEADVVIPEGVTALGAAAFEGNEAVSSVRIPDSVTVIGPHALRYCGKLTHVTVPDSVTEIGQEALDNDWELVSVRLGAGVRVIRNTAFNRCRSLTAVMLGSGVQHIEHDAFLDCPIRDVYYAGTKAQWDRIAIDVGNDSLTGAAIHFGSMGPEAAANASVGTKDGVPSVSVTLDCPEACASLQVLGARYSAEGQLLGLETVTVPSGASGAIEVPFGDGSVVKVFAIDSDAGIPVCAAVERVRP